MRLVPQGHSLLGCDTIQFGWCVPLFWRSLHLTLRVGKTIFFFTWRCAQ